MNFFEKQESSQLEELRRVCEAFPYHDYSFPTIYTYKDYPKLLTKNALKIEADGISINPSPKRRVFYFFQLPTLQRIQELTEAGFRCSSPSKLEGVAGSTKRIEPVYDLAKVFDPESYPNAKKRHQRIKYPFSFFEREGITVTQLSNEEVEQFAVPLHDKWVDIKTSDLKVHQHSFSTGRYRRCTRLAGDFPDIFRRYGVWSRNAELLAVRVVGIGGKRAFDLAFYSDLELMPSQLSEYANVVIMKKLFDEGIETLNAGLSAEARLSVYKHHYPCDNLISYQYAKPKEK